MNPINVLYKPVGIFVTPVYNCTCELLHLTRENLKPIIQYIGIIILSFALLSSIGYYRLAKRCLWWIFLGVMSSIGFGFGMHTFVLFLAPFIAAVTLAAHSCQSLDFPEPPYPDEIVCPESTMKFNRITFLDILQKISVESFMWGLGTAIGELPPYLAARLRVQAKRRNPNGDSSNLEDNTAGWELWMIKIITRVGFVGILLCAAIPNPLFDAAGVASGTAQIPFLSFFGATLIGKAVIKVLLQSSFVILAFHHNNLDSFIGQLDKRLSELSLHLKDLNLKGSLSKFLEEQRANVLRKHHNEPRQSSFISNLFNWMVCGFFALFIISLVRTLNERYMQRTKTIMKVD